MISIVQQVIKSQEDKDRLEQENHADAFEFIPMASGRTYYEITGDKTISYLTVIVPLNGDPDTKDDNLVKNNRYLNILSATKNAVELFDGVEVISASYSDKIEENKQGSAIVTHYVVTGAHGGFKEQGLLEIEKVIAGHLGLEEPREKIKRNGILPTPGPVSSERKKRLEKRAERKEEAKRQKKEKKIKEQQMAQETVQKTEEKEIREVKEVKEVKEPKTTAPKPKVAVPKVAVAIPEAKAPKQPVKQTPKQEPRQTAKQEPKQAPKQAPKQIARSIIEQAGEVVSEEPPKKKAAIPDNDVAEAKPVDEKPVRRTVRRIADVLEQRIKESENKRENEDRSETERTVRKAAQTRKAKEEVPREEPVTYAPGPQVESSPEPQKEDKETTHSHRRQRERKNIYIETESDDDFDMNRFMSNIENPAEDNNASMPIKDDVDDSDDFEDVADDAAEYYDEEQEDPSDDMDLEESDTEETVDENNADDEEGVYESQVEDDSQEDVIPNKNEAQHKTKAAEKIEVKAEEVKEEEDEDEIPYLNRIDTFESPISLDNPELEYALIDRFDTMSTTASPEKLKNILQNTIRYITRSRQPRFKAAQIGEIKPDELMEDAVSYINQHFQVASSDLDALKGELYNALFSYYKLTDAINDPDISDIKVLQPNKINVKVKGKHYTLRGTKFIDGNDYTSFIWGLLLRNGTDFGRKTIYVFTDTNFHKDYILRFNISTPEINTTPYPIIHIRKTEKNKMFLEDLCDAGMFPEKLIDYLKYRVKTSSIICSGPPASGKTKLLNALIEEIPYTAAGIVIQESDELFPQEHPNIMCQHIINNPYIRDGVKDLNALGTNGLLCDVNYFIIGEIKGEEARTFLKASNTGNKVMCSVHCESAKDAIPRLADYVKYGADYSLEEAERMLRDLRTIIYIEGFKIREIVEIERYDDEKKCMVYKTVYERKYEPEAQE